MLLLAVVMTAAAMRLLYPMRGESPFADEWGFFVYRGHGWTDTLFAPNNGSLILVPLLVYRTVFKRFGPSITVLRFVLMVLELVCAALFFELTRRRVGEWMALGGATLLLFLGAGWLLATTVGITLYVAVGLGPAALIAIERGDRRGDVVACALLVLTIASYNAAVPFAAGLASATGLFRIGRTQRRMVLTMHLRQLRKRARGAGAWAVPFLLAHDLVECWAVARGGWRYRTLVL
ncbi:MAG: hypothetical protein ACR2OB_12295 [Solirubrobacteraceae bacterium]